MKEVFKLKENIELPADFDFNKDRAVEELILCWRNNYNNTYGSIYTPDTTYIKGVSSCNSSIASQMLYTIPKKTWSNINTRILDPACKSGVFLLGAYDRLMEGLAEKIPDKKKRSSHILLNCLFAYCTNIIDCAIVRIVLYGDKHIKGNIQHINILNLSKREVEKMKFDIVIGNPPYQSTLDNNSDDQHGRAKPIYQYFIDKAITLSKNYVCMIVPSKWYLNSKSDENKKLLDTLLDGEHFIEIHDYDNPYDVFNARIASGVMYFLYSKDYTGDVNVYAHEKINNKDTIISSSKRKLVISGTDTFIRRNEDASIFSKVNAMMEKTGDISFSTICSSMTPYGFLADDYKNDRLSHTKCGNNLVYCSYSNIGYVRNGDKIKTPCNASKFINKIGDYKVFIPKAMDNGLDFRKERIVPKIGLPNELCTSSYLVIGSFKTLAEAENCVSYINTKFFHCLMFMKKIGQNMCREIYSYIPLFNNANNKFGDFSHPWTDALLYDLVDLSANERNYIESTIFSKCTVK